MRSKALLARAAGVLLVLGLVTRYAVGDPVAAIEAVSDPQAVVDAYGPDALLLHLAQLVLLGLCVWCGVCVTAFAAAALRPTNPLRTFANVVTPHSGRAAIVALLGVGTLAMAACAQQPSSSAAQPSTPPAYVASADPFDWPRAEALPIPQAEVEPQAQVHVEASNPVTTPQYVVTDGDCLWAIANERLTAASTPAQIAYLVEEIYHLNRSAIGPDPDALRPGTVLALPTG